MTPATWLGVVSASLLGSAHCAAMCGSFVAAYASGEDVAQPSRRALAHLAYNGGRLTTYTLLGAAAGAAGHALDLAGKAQGLAGVAGIVTGVLLVFWGATGLRPRAALIRLRPGPKRGVSAFISRFFASFLRRPALARAGLLGLASTLLPCGWLYAFVAVAAAQGSAVDGALVMSAFWAGSLPVMLGVGWSLAGVARRINERLPRLRSSLVLGAGVMTLLFRFQLAPLAQAHPAAATPGSELPKAKDCPCHTRNVNVNVNVPDKRTSPESG